jgi:hypothetical protein
MLVRIGIWLTRVLGIAFFTGLAGCAFCVIFSWISILKDGFSRDNGEH